MAPELKQVKSSDPGDVTATRIHALKPQTPGYGRSTLYTVRQSTVRALPARKKRERLQRFYSVLPTASRDFCRSGSDAAGQSRPAGRVSGSIVRRGCSATGPERSGSRTGWPLMCIAPLLTADREVARGTARTAGSPAPGVGVPPGQGDSSTGQRAVSMFTGARGLR